MFKYKVLCVDDDQIFLEYYNDIFSDIDDIELRLVRTAEDFIPTVRYFKPDVILMDVQLNANTSGYELAKQIQTMRCQTPIIFVTALMSDEDQVHAFECGAVDFIGKPSHEKIILTRVRNQLNNIALREYRNMQHAAVELLGKLSHMHDENTGNHIWRVGGYSKLIAERLGWNPIDADTLASATPLHDIGKASLPLEVLTKQGTLTDEEWEIMRTHPKLGYDLLGGFDQILFRMAADVAYCHHENWDGSGYPNQLKGNEIPESARILAIADVYDALTTDRPYKEAWSSNKAVELINSWADTKFDPRIVEAFMQVLPEIEELRIKLADK